MDGIMEEGLLITPFSRGGISHHCFYAFYVNELLFLV